MPSAASADSAEIPRADQAAILANRRRDNPLIALRHLLLNGTAFIDDNDLLSRSGIAFDPGNRPRGRLDHNQ
jgi:hypothetical protein